MKIRGGRLVLLLIGIIMVFIGVSYVRVITCDEKYIKFVNYQMCGAIKTSFFVAKKTTVSSVKLVTQFSNTGHGGWISYYSWVQFHNGRKETLLCANSEKRVTRICKELEHSLSSEQGFKLVTFPLKIIAFAGMAIMFLARFGNTSGPFSPRPGP